MTFRQKVAAIKREHRKRQPPSLYSEMCAITLRKFSPAMRAALNSPNLFLRRLIDDAHRRDTDGGVWGWREQNPLSFPELSERSRQYSALRELEGA